MEQKNDQNNSAIDSFDSRPVTETRSDEVSKTPVRPSKGTKRKYPPDTPSSSISSTPSRVEDGNAAKKRRRSSSSMAMSRVGSPGTSLLKPAMTERQQMALLLQMTDPNKHQSPGSPAVSSNPVTPEVTPKRLQRKNERGETPLHLAAIKGDLKAVISLLRQGADVKVTDHAGWTPLHEACNYGRSAVARELLAHGADVGAVGMDGDTPMHDAAINGHLETVRVLLQHGGNPQHTNEKGLTPIDVCTHSMIIDLLKSHDKSHTHHTDNESSAKDAEENPCPKCSDSSSHDNIDFTDKEELSPVFSRECTPVKVTTPTQQAMTTPTQTPPTQTKKTRLRGVSFSDISSSESDLELMGDSKECEKDGPIDTQIEEFKSARILSMEATKDERKSKGYINGEQLSDISDDDEKFVKRESSPESERDSDPASPPERSQDMLPDPSSHTSTSLGPEEETTQLVAPGHDSRVEAEKEDEEETMLLSIPLSAVRVSSSCEKASLEARVDSKDSKGNSPLNPAPHSNSDGDECGVSVGGEGVTGVGEEGVGCVTLNCKKTVKEGRKERTTQEPAEAESFSIRLDRNTIKSPTDPTPTLHVTHGPIRTQSKDSLSPDYVRTPDNCDPPQMNPSEPSNTVISFRTSLPLIFSSQSTPPTTVSRLSVPCKSSSPSPESGRSPDPGFKRSGSQDSLSLPPKLRYRPVVQSAVIQQRMNHALQNNESSDLPLFSLLGRCQLREAVTPVSPKSVYPPLPSSLHKQFSEQETERARLATAHSVEQDRLRLSLIQELLRAQQRAKKGQPSLSVCSLLLEKLLPSVPYTEPGLKVETIHSPAVRPRDGEDGLNSRLLSGLVQDVWDKFRALKFSLLSRQRHEAEALWLTQREQWMCAQEELGGGLSVNDIPFSHVPLVSPGNHTSPQLH